MPTEMTLIDLEDGLRPQLNVDGENVSTRKEVFGCKVTLGAVSERLASSHPVGWVSLAASSHLMHGDEPFPVGIGHRLTIVVHRWRREIRPTVV